MVEKKLINYKNMDNFNKLNKEYKRYIEKLSNDYSIYNKEHKDDIYQEGLIGLYEATLKYDETKGEFKQFACFYIKKYMMNYLSKNIRTIRIPDNNRYSTKDNVITNIPTISIDTPLDENITLEDVLYESDIDSSLDDESLFKQAKINSNFNKLKDEYKYIINEVIFNNRTFVDIAKELGCTKENIRIKYNLGIDKLKKC